MVIQEIQISEIVKIKITLAESFLSRPTITHNRISYHSLAMKLSVTTEKVI